MLNAITPEEYRILLTENFRHERQRRVNTISLTANENILSDTARVLCQNRFYDRYYFKGREKNNYRYASDYNGMCFEKFPEVEKLKDLAVAAALRLFSAEFIDFRLLSGVHCTISMVAILSEPGDLILSLDPSCGGHFATKSIIEKLGRKSQLIKLDNNLFFDEEDFCRIIDKTPPRMIIIDHGLTNSMISTKALKNCLKTKKLNDVKIIYDASHLLGLIAGKVVDNPLDYGADILQGNTHKSFPGPHRAIVICRNRDIASRISHGLASGMVSSPNLPTLLQLFITMLEMDCYAEQYAKEMCKNSMILSHELSHIESWRVLPTATHQIIIIENESAKLASILNETGIRVNNKSLYGNPCLRLGVQEITRLGISEQQIVTLASLIRTCVTDSKIDFPAKTLMELSMNLNSVKYSFDNWEY